MDLRPIFANKKTTAAGVALILTGAASVLTAYSNGEFSTETLLTTLIATIGGVAALLSKDADKR